MVSAIFYELRRQTASQARDRRPAAEMHRRIYQAIRERNRALAQTLMSDHLLGAEREQESEATPPARHAGPGTNDGERRVCRFV